MSFRKSLPCYCCILMICLAIATLTMTVLIYRNVTSSSSTPKKLQAINETVGNFCQTADARNMTGAQCVSGQGLTPDSKVCCSNLIPLCKSDIDSGYTDSNMAGCIDQYLNQS
jgi:hypothetical protein